MPIDIVDLNDPDELEDSGSPLSYLADNLKPSTEGTSSYVVINAGRTGPKGLDTNAVSRTLTKQPVPERMLIAYVSTGTQENFTTKLHREIIKTDILAEDVFKSLAANARAAGDLPQKKSSRLM